MNAFLSTKAVATAEAMGMSSAAVAAESTQSTSTGAHRTSPGSGLVDFSLN